MNAGSADGGSEISQVTSKKHSRKPKYSRFTQQELPACKPILTPGWVITAFVFVGIIFIPIGLASLFASESVVEIVERYDKDCVPSSHSNDVLGFIQSSQTNKTCIKTLTVPKKMKQPIYVYYELDNFYQNHRRYVKSRSDKQLRSKKHEDVTKDCSPEATIDGKPIVPCGLIAWSLFNDTYGFSLSTEPLQVNKKEIAWSSDRSSKFGSDVYPKNFQKGLIGGAKLNESQPLNEQENLIVWMRPAALPTFRKLYGRIEVDLEANEKIEVAIENNYNTYSFGGKKKLVLSTTSWVGGKNDFLGVAYLTVGGLCLFMAIGFILLYVVRPRPLGDPSYLSWNRNPGGLLN
ncbi:ALA-interacting subunit 5-like [Diospyros lotus]|uniref:ALA-interacting subunit 5-like n=1 Tax=Diospyros lotus TaxID=55363 RepID=UPI00225427D0|nr:ALA-interacting subunit 5-like [Diospyros lotus]